MCVCVCARARARARSLCKNHQSLTGQLEYFAASTIVPRLFRNLLLGSILYVLVKYSDRAYRVTTVDFDHFVVQNMNGVAFLVLGCVSYRISVYLLPWVSDENNPTAAVIMGRTSSKN